MSPLPASWAGMNGALPFKRSESRSGPSWDAAPSPR